MTGKAILREANLCEQVLSMNEHMEELAAAGEWQQVASLVTKRNAMLQEIDDSVREESLVAARRSTDRIKRMAEDAQNQVAEKIAQLHRGRKATQIYQSNA